MGLAAEPALALCQRLVLRHVYTALGAAHHGCRLVFLRSGLGGDGRAVEVAPQPDGGGDQGDPEQQTEHDVLFSLAGGQFSQGAGRGAAGNGRLCALWRGVWTQKREAVASLFTRALTSVEQAEGQVAEPGA